ncbi:MAG TPA: DnaJ domain-containing protein [Thermoanaerobaculia bacterium]
MPSSSRLSEEELRLFSERIASSLKERPLPVSEQAHRERVAALVREVGDSTFYQLLGLDPTASNQAIHDAYDRLGRMVHRENARRLGLVGREGVLDLLFEKVTEAYLTLSHSEWRKRYDREQGANLWKGLHSSPPVSQDEEAQRLYERACALVKVDQHYTAIELLRQAVRIKPRPEYLAMLGLAQAKNPHWLRKAEKNLTLALETGSKDPTLPAALEEVRARLARMESGEQADPDDEEASVL